MPLINMDACFLLSKERRLLQMSRGSFDDLMPLWSLLRTVTGLSAGLTSSQTVWNEGGLMTVRFSSNDII